MFAEAVEALVSHKKKSLGEFINWILFIANF